MKEVHYILTMNKGELVNLNKMRVSWAEPKIKHSNRIDKEVTKMAEDKIVETRESEHKTEINVDMTGVQKQIAELKEEIQRLEGKKVTKSSFVDETSGIVGTNVEEDVDESRDSGLVLEQAETGKGFALYRDYSKDESGKLKRLVR